MPGPAQVDAAGRGPLDALAVYNAGHDPDLGADVGWTPTLHRHIDPAWAVPALVHAGAGA